MEDWFQVENFKSYIPFSAWSDCELRVETNTLRILDLLDGFDFRPRATFFILGWIADKCPDLVREIFRRGHEVASHGRDHHLCRNLTPSQLFDDLKASKDRLESIIDSPVQGFRAPSFAIDDVVLQTIAQAGYTYDSSYNSFSAHGRYGSIDLTHAEKKQAAYQISDRFFELPISNLKIRDTVIPLGGGGYFRLFPFALFSLGMTSILKKNRAFVFYAHPWEFDPGQPRVDQASRGFKFRHYTNLHKTESKLKAMLDRFKDLRWMTCSDYLKDLFQP